RRADARILDLDELSAVEEASPAVGRILEIALRASLHSAAAILRPPFASFQRDPTRLARAELPRAGAARCPDPRRAGPRSARASAGRCRRYARHDGFRRS